jgi:hypothetical protein
MNFTIFKNGKYYDRNYMVIRFTLPTFAMEVVNRLVTQSLSDYLKNLPVPKSLFGFARLSGNTLFIANVFFIHVRGRH